MGNVCCPRKGIQELQRKLIIQNQKKAQVKQKQQQIPQQHQQPHSPNPIRPKFQSKSQPRKSSDIQMIESISGKFQRRNNVWGKFEQQSEIVYCNYEPRKQLFMSFALKKKINSTNRYLTSYQYIQKKVKSSHLSLIIRQGKNFGREKKNIIGTAHNQANIIIANLIDNGEEKMISNFPHGEEIFIQNTNQLRLSVFSQIYLCLENENDVQRIKKICQFVTDHMTFEERKRVVYMFSAQIKLEQVAKIVFHALKNFIIAKPIQQIADNLLYDIELIDKEMISVKRKCQRATLRSVLPLSIGFLMQQVSATNFQFYSALMNDLKIKNIKEYLKCKQSLDELRYNSANDDKIIQKIKQLNFFTAEKFQKFKKLAQKTEKIQLSPQYNPKIHSLFIINKEVQEKIGKFYIEYLQAEKAQNTPVKKDWDDSLNVEDFYVPPRKYTDEVNYLEALRQNETLNPLQEEEMFEESVQVELQTEQKQSQPSQKQQ